MNQILDQYEQDSDSSEESSKPPAVNYKSRADKEYVDEDSQDNSSESDKTTKSKVNRTNINYLRSQEFKL